MIIMSHRSDSCLFFFCQHLLICPGDNGYLGISKPVEYGGLGLDYSYEIAAAEAFATIN